MSFGWLKVFVICVILLVSFSSQFLIQTVKGQDHSLDVKNLQRMTHISSSSCLLAARGLAHCTLGAVGRPHSVPPQSLATSLYVSRYRTVEPARVVLSSTQLPAGSHRPVDGSVTPSKVSHGCTVVITISRHQVTGVLTRSVRALSSTSHPAHHVA